MCSGATEGEMKLDTYVGKRISLCYCSFFSHRSYTDLRDKNCIMYQDYISRSFKLFPSRVCNIPYVFPVVRHADNFYVFCACVTIKEGGDSNIVLTRPQNILNYCNKTVIFNL